MSSTGANEAGTASTKIIDVTGDEPKYIKGYVTEKSVVIPGSEPKIKGGTFNVPCALIIEKERKALIKRHL